MSPAPTYDGPDAWADLRTDADEVVSVGYWPAPPGPFVYNAVNKLTGQRYVGMTIDFVIRVRAHYAAAEKGRSPLYRAMREWGADAFVFVPIEAFADEAAMKQGERTMIRQLRTQDPAFGYNVADGGEGIGSLGAKAVHARPEYRAKFLSSRFERAAKAVATKARRTSEGYYRARVPICPGTAPSRAELAKHIVKELQAGPRTSPQMREAWSRIRKEILGRKFINEHAWALVELQRNGLIRKLGGPLVLYQTTDDAH